MYNITINRELFYSSSKKLEVIIVAEATSLTELFYIDKERIYRREVIQLLVKELDLLLNKPTKQQLRSRATLEPKLVESQSTNKRATKALLARIVRLAN